MNPTHDSIALVKALQESIDIAAWYKDTDCWTAKERLKELSLAFLKLHQDHAWLVEAVKELQYANHGGDCDCTVCSDICTRTLSKLNFPPLK